MFSGTSKHQAGWLFMLLLLGFAPALRGDSSDREPRRPRGIYSVVDIDGHIVVEQKKDPYITAADLHAFFTGHYANVLANPAISGLTLQVGWARLNPAPPSSPAQFDWSYLEDAFHAIETWNDANSDQPPKTVQIQIFPGYFTPDWVFAQIPSCDSLFAPTPVRPPDNCGKVTFAGFGEPVYGLTVLPLPWNEVYKSAYKSFLIAFARKYNHNRSLVSVDIDGPTAASSEIMVPNSGNVPYQFGGIPANQVWLQLLRFAFPTKPPEFQTSDQVFIDEWNAAIDMFGEIFSGITFVCTHGSQLPNFATTGFTIPAAFASQCATPPSMDCAAEATIFAHFSDPSVGGDNAKAVQGSGLNGHARPVSNILKWLAERTQHFKSPSAQILAGEQMSSSFTFISQGCRATFPPTPSDKPPGCTIPPGCSSEPCMPPTCIPQACLAYGVTQADLSGYKQFSDIPTKYLLPVAQSVDNALKDYFDGTPVAAVFGGTLGDVPQNYLQIYDFDILYTNAHVGETALVVQADGTMMIVSVQDLLNLASQKLLAIAEGAPTSDDSEQRPSRMNAVGRK